MTMNVALGVALAVLHALAIADIWMSRLSRTAKVFWTLALPFLFPVGVLAWLLTRHTAHQELEEIPEAAP